MQKQVLMLIGAVGMTMVVSCGRESTTQPDSRAGGVWVPTAANQRAWPYGKQLQIVDVTGQHRLSIDLYGTDSAQVNRLGSDCFRLEVLPLNPAEYEGGGSECGVGVDGRRPSADYLHPPGPTTSPPPLFFKFSSEGGDPPAHFRLTPRQAIGEYAALVEGGPYQSLTLQRAESGSSAIQFFHHHGSGDTHLLYQGLVDHCAYAYDAGVDHGISGWRTSHGDEAVVVRADGYGRCH